MRAARVEVPDRSGDRRIGRMLQCDTEEPAKSSEVDTGEIRRKHAKILLNFAAIKRGIFGKGGDIPFCSGQRAGDDAISVECHLLETFGDENVGNAVVTGVKALEIGLERTRDCSRHE